MSDEKTVFSGVEEIKRTRKIYRGPLFGDILTRRSDVNPDALPKNLTGEQDFLGRKKIEAETAAKVLKELNAEAEIHRLPPPLRAAAYEIWRRQAENNRRGAALFAGSVAPGVGAAAFGVGKQLGRLPTILLAPSVAATANRPAQNGAAPLPPRRPVDLTSNGLLPAPTSPENLPDAGGSTALYLSDKDIIDMKKAVNTEVAKKLKDEPFKDQLHGVMDTMINRQASGHWGSTMKDVVDARKQFSDVNGPIAWKHRRHSVDDIDMESTDPRVNAEVERWLQMRAAGAPSSVGDNLNYANPNFSDAVNMHWINKLQGPRYGAGKAVHWHGTTDDLKMFRTEAQPHLGDHPNTRRSVEVGRAPSLDLSALLAKKAEAAGTSVGNADQIWLAGGLDAAQADDPSAPQSAPQASIFLGPAETDSVMVKDALAGLNVAFSPVVEQSSLQKMLARLQAINAQIGEANGGLRGAR